MRTRAMRQPCGRFVARCMYRVPHLRGMTSTVEMRAWKHLEPFTWGRRNNRALGGVTANVEESIRRKNIWLR